MWTYTIKNKLLASVVLLALCLLVLLSNFLDRRHTRHVKNSIATMYEDRLIAEDYILKMTGNIYQIREVVNSDSSTISKSGAINKLLAGFNEWYGAYIKTKLTTTEQTTSNELIGCIHSFEKNLSNNHLDLSNDTEKAIVTLNKLSTIQLEESKLIMKSAESEYAMIKTSSEFAFAIIILILVVLQAIVFSAKTLLPLKKPKDPMLN